MSAIVKLTDHQRESGDNLEQWGVGMVGAMFTTLPAFLFIPVWFVFSEKYRVCKDDTNEIDTAACFFIGLGFGASVWLGVIASAAIYGSTLQ